MGLVLAVDIGNTNIVIGCIINEKVISERRIETDCARGYEEYAYDIKKFLDTENIIIKAIEGSIISSVVPQLTNVLEKAIEVIIGLRPIIVGAELETGLNFLVDNPEQLGSDRIADAIAAKYYYSEADGAVIIFDMGTATTVSVIDENFNFLGGMIMLGLKSSLNALSYKAAQLPSMVIDNSMMGENLIGKNTTECMLNGSIYGHAAMVDGIIRRLKEQVGRNTKVVATGGLARVVMPYCEEVFLYDEHLLLKGLYLIYQRIIS